MMRLDHAVLRFRSEGGEPGRLAVVLIHGPGALSLCESPRDLTAEERDGILRESLRIQDFLEGR